MARTKQVDTTAFSITDVKDSLIDSGIDIDGDITDVPAWRDEKVATGMLSHRIYVHQVPSLIAHLAMNPELWGQTIGLYGPTAIGKTEAIKQGFQEAADAMRRTLQLTEVHVSQMGPVDAVGVPRERDGRTYWAPSEIWPLAEVLEKHDGHVTKVQNFLRNYEQTGLADYELLPKNWYCHFHDEVTNPSNPQVTHQLFPSWLGDHHGRRMGGHLLVPDMLVVLAGNRLEDGTNSINLAASAVTRQGIFQVVPHFGGYLQNYAFKTKQLRGRTVTKVHPSVIAYLNKFNRQFAPQEMNERSPMDPFPTPRNWTYVSEQLYANEQSPMPQDLLRASVASRVGDSTAQEFFTFISHYKDLPDVDKLMRGAEITNFPKKDRPELLAILGTQMVIRLDQSNAKVFMRYMLDETKFPAEFSAMTMKQLRPAGKLQPLVREWATAEFSQWTKAMKTFVF